MMRWLWRDHGDITADPKNTVERSLRPAVKR
jgi:hypothetical protein